MQGPMTGEYANSLPTTQQAHVNAGAHHENNDIDALTDEFVLMTVVWKKYIARA
jgi:hypothetical protein